MRSFARRCLETVLDDIFAIFSSLDHADKFMKYFLPRHANINFPMEKEKHFTLKQEICIRKNIFACLFSVHNTISLSRHEQVICN